MKTFESQQVRKDNPQLIIALHKQNKSHKLALITPLQSPQQHKYTSIHIQRPSPNQIIINQ